MSSTHRIKTVAATLTVGFLLTAALAATGFAGNTQSSQAVEARAAAMNRFYGLGTGHAAVQRAEERRAQATNSFYGVGTFGSTSLQQAEERRSEAMNQYYGVGAANDGVARQAEQRRSEAVNRYYHVGRYAVVSVSNPFDWADAGVGAGTMLGAIVLAFGLALAVRRRGIGDTSSASTT